MPYDSEQESTAHSADATRTRYVYELIIKMLNNVSGLIVNNSAEIPLEVLDARISSLKAELSALIIHRNTRIPIFRLPDDILSIIFFEYANNNYGYDLFALKWTPIMFVCRRWCNVATNEKRLWSFIAMRSPTDFQSRMHQQIIHSGGYPLTVMVSMSDEHYFKETPLECFRVLFKPQAVRLQHFTALGDARDVRPILDAMSTWALPALQSIEVEAFSNVLSESVIYHLPDNLLGGKAGPLRSLTLTNMPFSWELAGGLHHLFISNAQASVEHITARTPTLTQIFSLLKRSPALRTLGLKLSIARELSGPFPAPIELPELNSLTLLDVSTHFPELLSSIVIPSTASIKLTALKTPFGPVENLRELLVPLRQHFRSKSAYTSQSLKLDSDKSNSRLTISMYTTRPKTFSDKLNFSLCIAQSTTELQRHEIIRKVLMALPMDSVTHLYTHEPYSPLPLTETTWETVFSLLPAVHTLVLGAFHTLAISGALLQMMAFPHNTFPRIKCIKFHACVGQSAGAKISQDISAILLRLLTRYKELGVPLEVFDAFCHKFIISDDTFDAISAVVGKVVRVE